jgi:hypothetical protein
MVTLRELLAASREWFCVGQTSKMPIFKAEPATGGVLAACGLRDLRELLFK